MAAKFLAEVPKEEQKSFLDSFDTIYCDVDGVLWNLELSVLIEGAAEGIKALRNLGKKVYFVSNNSTVPLDAYLERLKIYDVAKEEIIRPSFTLSWYLKKQKFEKEVYVIGFQPLKDDLRKAGFKVVCDELTPVEETVPGIAKMLRSIRPEVGAVIMDIAVNFDYACLQKCIQYIIKNKALFLLGTADPLIPFRGSSLIGAPHFARIIQEVTGVAPKILSKPGKEFREVLEDHMGPSDPSRILFIGDSPLTDMVFATDSGFQKVAPLTGYLTEDDLKNWKYEEKFKPDYVVDTLKVFSDVIDDLEVCKL